MLLLCFDWDASAAKASFNHDEVFRFDAGPTGSTVSPGALALTPGILYSQRRGFGWQASPPQAFVREGLRRSRDAMTIDGVSGSSLFFRADIAEGQWYVTLWLEADPLDQSRPQIKLQNQAAVIDWQLFAPAAESKVDLPKIYRVFRAAVEVGSEGFVFNLSDEGRQLRLLGMTLLKKKQASSSSEQNYLRELRLAASLDAPALTQEFKSQIQTLATAHPENSFFAYWNQQIQMLSLAEKYSSMRGWEWADEETGLGMFDRLHQTVILLDALLAVQATPEDPLADKVRFLRGKLLYWLGKERGGEQEIANGVRDLKILAEKYPENEILAMYLGKRAQSTSGCERSTPLETAPPWSSAQRETLCRLREIVHWWVEHQAENGEFGGKLGDDIELLRWWAPLCFAGDKAAIEGWEKLAEGVWQSDHVTAGYASKIADVEHAAEFIADTAPLMAVYRDDPKFLDRLRPSAELFETLWTAENSNSHRYFRSAWFSSTELDNNEPKDRDVEMNTRAVRALRYLTWRKPDPHVRSLLHDWSLAWTHAAMRTDKGKPRGIMPASVRFKDEAFSGDGDNWYEANMYWDYFDWQHSCGSMMLDQLLLTYLLTEDETLLKPLVLTLELLDTEEEADHESGSSGWVKKTLRQCRPFWQVVEQWRLHTGNPRFDDLILQYGSYYGRFCISGEEQHLLKGLQVLLEDVRYNVALKTSEAYFTDRVYVSEWELLKAMLTGDGISNNMSPYFQVTWEDTDDDFTALVLPTKRNQISLELFSHAAKQTTATMRVWKLPPGEYLMQSTKQGGDEVLKQIVKIEAKGQRLEIKLPPGDLLRVELFSSDER